MAVETISPIRNLHFVLTDLPLETCLTLPSIGIDFGSAFVRTAVVLQVHNADANDGSQRIAIDLTTFGVQNVDAALQHAKTVYAASSGDDETQSKLGVYYTGHASDERVKAIREAFPNAVTIERRDKLDCHSRGAQALINGNSPTADLFHNTSQSDEVLKELIAKTEMFKMIMPPKFQEVWDRFKAKIDAQGDAKFPATLGLLGSNFLIIKVESDATYKVLDAISCGGRSIGTMWKLADPERFTDFDTHIKLAEKGDRRKVDSLTTEVAEATGIYSAMSPDYPLFNFGKMEKLSRHQIAAEDLARGIIGVHSDLYFGKGLDLSFLANAFPLYYTGSLIQHEFIRDEILLRLSMMPLPGLKVPKFFKTDATAALGACFAV